MDLNVKLASQQQNTTSNHAPSTSTSDPISGQSCGTMPVQEASSTLPTSSPLLADAASTVRQAQVETQQASQHNASPMFQHNVPTSGEDGAFRGSHSTQIQAPTQQQIDQMAAQLPSMMGNVSMMEHAYPTGQMLARSNRQTMPEQHVNHWPMQMRYPQHMQQQPRTHQYGYAHAYHPMQSMAPPSQYTGHYYNMQTPLQFHPDSAPRFANYQPPNLVMAPPAPFASNTSPVNMHELQQAQQYIRDSNPPVFAPRGPPRKPRQSGYALWVGNLPPNAKIEDLKEHFSIGATKDIESIKLISKSNCAFVNYRSEQACAAALDRFHEMKFQGTRLVCRLRRRLSTATPTASEEATSDFASPEGGLRTGGDTGGEREISATGVVEKKKERLPGRYFVLKSLTLQDLELSSQTGVWATQSHNEAELNAAYQNSDNVYLIFSANKSGEYFGYARMTSPIDKSVPAELAAPIIPTPISPIHTDFSSHNETDVSPRSLVTPATEWAPKGYIIDDSMRGTIFWEADLGQEAIDAANSGETSIVDSDQPTIARSTGSPSGQKGTDESTKHSDVDQSSLSHGTPFKVQWMCLQRLPFYRVRGLRNPLNQNREVKIARDGTEIEPSVGHKLISMFHSSGYAGPMT